MPHSEAAKLVAAGYDPKRLSKCSISLLQKREPIRGRPNNRVFPFAWERRHYEPVGESCKNKGRLISAAQQFDRECGLQSLFLLRERSLGFLDRFQFTFKG
jgi:hypothetical protein